MKIIKRNGAEVPFDITKIITAVTKASDSVGGKARLSREQITDIAAAVTDQCQALNRAQRGRDTGYGGEPAHGHQGP
jgi:ATP cone domain.